MTTETEIQDTLMSLIENLADARDEGEGEDDDIALADIARDMVADAEGWASARSFQDVAMLTANAGVVLRMSDGSEFQITIVKSR
ncbi:MAG: hypothetical protein IPK83_18550 [Planctomycetes bacterium]|nr:hypothetical protein [Planctomycetota bacterium]